MKFSSIEALAKSDALESIDDATERADADLRAGLCPDGHGILSRAKAAWIKPFYVERCEACRGIWLDVGEWRRLSAERLLSHLGDLWLPAWRKRMQREHSALQVREVMARRFGPDLLTRIEAIAVDLAEHEHGEMGIAFLRDEFDRRRPRWRDK